MWGSVHRGFFVFLVGAAAFGGSILAGPGAGASHPAAVSGTATEVDPDTYTCTSGGFEGFEEFGDGQTLTNTSVAGMGLAGFQAGDFGTGKYDGKFPAGDYSSEQTRFATATGSTAPKITLAQPASTVSVLVDTAIGNSVTVRALDASSTVIGSVTHIKSSKGRHMILFGLQGDSKLIRAVVVDVGTGFFTVDSVCTDAPTVSTGQITLKYGDGPPGMPSYMHGFGFQPGERVSVAVQGDDVTLSPPADIDGHFDLAFVVPATAPPGSNHIVATGVLSGIKAYADFLVHTDWNQYGYDGQKAAYNPNENILSASAVQSGLHVAWTATVGGNQASSAAIAQGVVYVDSKDGSAYAFREGSTTSPPASVGQVATGGPISPTPTVDSGRVFIAGADGHIYGFDPQLGPAHLWQYPALGTTSHFVFNRSPAVRDLVLYATDNKGSVIALNEPTGKPVKGWPITLPGNPMIHSAAAVDDKYVYVGADNGMLYAINRSTHAIAWQKAAGTMRLGDPVLSNLNFSGGKVFVGSADGHVYAFNTDGTQAWRKPSVSVGGYAVDQTLAVASGVLYVGVSDPTGNLQARSVLNGKLSWHTPTGGAINSKPAIADGVIYITNAAGDLVALSPAGAILRTISVGSLTPSAPAVTNGAIYVGTGDGRLVKYVH